MYCVWFVRVVQGPPDANPEVTEERLATHGRLSAAEQDTLSMHTYACSVYSPVQH